MTCKNLTVPRRTLSVLRQPAWEVWSARLWAVFQIAVLAAIVSLIIGLLWRQEARGPEESIDIAVVHGQTLRRSDFPPGPRLAPPALGDPDRIRQLLQPGQTYVVRTKGGFAGRTHQGERLGRQGIQNFLYAFETAVHRTIESNNGRRIVELRRFQTARNAVLLSTSALELNLGEPGAPLLEGFPELGHDPGARSVPGIALAEAIAGGGAEALAGGRHATGMLEVESLSGKQVRLSYVDGVGIESIRPVGCDLTAAELRYLLAVPVLYDALLVPPPSRAGSAGPWPAPRDQLAGLLGWSLREQQPDDLLVQAVPRPVGAAPTQEHRLVSAAETQSDGVPGPSCGTFYTSRQDGRVQMAQLELSLDEGSAPALNPLFLEVPLERHSPVVVVYASTRQPAAEAAPPEAPVHDLLAGLGLLLGGSIGLFWLGIKTPRWCAARTSHVLASATVFSILVFGAWVHKAVWLAELMPFSNVIILSNWLPLGAAYFSGILFAQRMIPLWRRAAMALLLTGLGGYTAMGDMSLVTDPTCRSWFRDGVCLQTLPETCSPCSAVTLLKHRGIETDEAEMTRLCLTRRRGTPMLGLYRGLKLKTHGTPWDVEVVRGDLEYLRQSFDGPVLLRVQNDAASLLAPEAGWPAGDISPDVEHSVVLLGFTPDGRAEIGDPANTFQPRSRWTLEDLEKRWQGEGFRLVRRGSSR